MTSSESFSKPSSTSPSKRSHDQRKGQWLYNKLRPNSEFENKLGKVDEESIIKYKAYVADRLWNLTNKEFEELMRQYDQ